MLMRVLVLALLNSLSSPGFAGFYQEVVRTKSKNFIETVLHLKSMFPQSFAQDYTLIHSSQSLQRGSHTEPRVLLMAEDGRSLMAFSGCRAENSTEHQIEFIDFGEDERFHFNQVSFSLESHSQESSSHSPHNVDCQSCHKGAPIWDAYPFWPTVFKSEPHSGHFDPYGLADKQQQTHYQTFLKEIVPRQDCFYSNLEGLETQYRDRPGFDVNTRFSQAIGYFNYRRLTAEIKQNPQYPKLRFALTAALIGCKDLAKYVPAKMASEFPLTQEALRLDTEAQQAKSKNIFTREATSHEIARLRYVLQGFNVFPEEWSTSLVDKDHYELIMPVGTSSDYISAILAELDPALAPYILYRTSEDPREPLLLKSVGTLAGLDERCVQLENLQNFLFNPFFLDVKYFSQFLDLGVSWARD